MNIRRKITCYTSEIPLNCRVDSDIYTNNGVLLCQRGTLVSSVVRDKLSRYRNKVEFYILTDENSEIASNTDFKKDDTSWNLSDSLRKHTQTNIAEMYNNINEPEKMVNLAENICTGLCDSICNSENVGINLLNLKISDEYTFKHSVDVATMSALIANALGESDSYIKDTAMAGILHDIGKSRVPIEVLNKPSRLTSDEFEVIKKHPLWGYEMLKEVPDISEEIRQAILQHHENIDGTGYPLGLKGNRILKMAKILTIADVYDALVTSRPYKGAKTPATAIEIMLGMFNKFELEILTAFLGVVFAYPNGTEVTLNKAQGKFEQCVVIKQSSGYPIRPVVKSLETGEIYDLVNDLQCLSYVIV